MITTAMRAGEKCRARRRDNEDDALGPWPHEGPRAAEGSGGVQRVGGRTGGHKGRGMTKHSLGEPAAVGGKGWPRERRPEGGAGGARSWVREVSGGAAKPSTVVAGR